MKKILALALFLLPLLTTSQNLQSPSDFLGYELGTQFTRHHEVIDYYKHVEAAAPDRVSLQEYGQTNERRPLMLAFLSSATNMQNLETIKQNHAASRKGGSDNDIAIVWLSYNVHGNESVSTEASMQTIYDLLTSKSDYLENTVVIMDPCINPDGRDRYVNWYNQYKNTPHQVDPNSKEHHEGWWTGRTNHYMFDLNRDWAWLTQVESRQRLKQFKEWLPHIHVDFHEQGVNNPYFFAPAAQPYHEVITQFQSDFQETIGRNHAKYFDANGWFYFTKEVFDLFYPSYGDTYPTYSGGIGMTYEQGGSGRAGLGVITAVKDTLTLKDRIEHHRTTGLSTVEVARDNAARLNEEYRKFYQRKNFKYQSYIFNGNPDKLAMLAELMDAHDIEYSSGSGISGKGYRYLTGRNGTLRGDANSLLIRTNQERGTMVKVLFEPNAKLSDSLTYDITAWSLPFAFGLDALASEADLNGNQNWQAPQAGKASMNDADYAYISDWNSMQDARFLSALLQKKIRVRRAHKPFSIAGKSYDRGSLIITRADNATNTEFQNQLAAIASVHNANLIPVRSGFVDSGKDFGSAYVDMIPQVKVAILAGGPTSAYRFGEIWHFFEQQLHYPLTVLDADYINRVDLSEYDVLVLPDGWGYGSFMDENKLKEVKKWVSSGGRLIAIGRAISAIDGENGFKIKTKDPEGEENQKETVAPYEAAEREQMKNAITGAIFKTKVDVSNPLAYGYDDTYFTLKLGNTAFDYLKRGTAVYIDSDTKPVSGFAGSEAQKKLGKTLIFGVENHGRGEVVYMVDNPLFRAFWEGGKLFFANALFMVD